MNALLLIVAILFITTLVYLYKIVKDRSKIASSLDLVSDISFDLTGSAEQVSTVSSDLLNASLEQLDSINSTISASFEINSMVMKTNENTKDLNDKSLKLQNIATEGREIVKDMVNSSYQIKEGSEFFKKQMQESISELSNTLMVIKEIADKTKMINEIVFQTKLLSFNASVEAARAGEHGNGFSIVAQEIGKLAEVSGKSANDISSIVEKSVKSVSILLDSTRLKIESLTNDTAKRGEAGYAQAKSCETIFASINNEISEMNVMVLEITSATHEQSLGVLQLDKAIGSLQEVADRNRLVASQSTEHAHSFEDQAKQLIVITQDMKFHMPKKNGQRARLQQFIWSDKLSLGVDVMDDEHKILIQKINNLVINLEKQTISKDKKSLLAAFTDLANYTVEHFSHEEKFMETMNYPQLNSHKKIHEKLLNQVGLYGQQIQNETLDDRKLIGFLRNWLISHIMGVDMQYANQFNHKVA